MNDVLAIYEVDGIKDHMVVPVLDDEISVDLLEEYCQDFIADFLEIKWYNVNMIEIHSLFNDADINNILEEVFDDF